MGKTIRWGFMGCGKIASDFANAMKNLPSGEHEIVAVAARDLKRAQAFAKEFGAKNAYEGYENIAKCEEVDVVYIDVINPKHLECVKLSLNGGKPTLCEKPLGMNRAEVREMIDLAKSKNVFFMEAFWSRCFPIYDEIRSALAAGKIGEPKLLQGNFGMQMDPKENARVLQKDLGGSALMDLGCYLMMVTTLIFDGQRPESIHACGKLNADGVDVLDCITMKYKNDACVQLFISAEINMSQKVQVFGTKGKLELPGSPGSFNAPDKLLVNDKEIVHPLPPVNAKYNFPNSQGLAYEAKHVRDCLLKGLKESPYMPLEHTDVIASILEEVRRQTGVVYPADEKQKQ